MATFSRRCTRLASESIRLYASCNRWRTISSKVTIPSLSFSTLHNTKLQKPLQQQVPIEPKVQISKNIENSLHITFADGSEGMVPYTWLRDNCQCPECYDGKALARKFIINDLKLDVKPTHFEVQNENLLVTWNDGHKGFYDLHWLNKRSFTSKARDEYRKLYQLEQVSWGKDLKLDEFDFSSLFSNDRKLFDFLTTVESKGVALVKNTPLLEDSGAKLIDHIAYTKNTHFGRRSPVKSREEPNNLAFTPAKLGLHNDVPTYDHQPGCIYIHMIKQHEGKGGESLVSDGLYCAELMKEKYPKEFEALANTDVYFWDKGARGFYLEMENFYKINKGPILELDSNGNLIKVRVNNAVRDSHLDLPADKVNEFYKAMKLYYDLLNENAYCFKMENGDMLTLDNVRCQHGREAYSSQSERHIESTYIDWDEARCRRRRLQEKFNII